MEIIKGRFTTRGRITIPAMIRKKYGLTPGGKVKFEATKDGVRIIPLATKKEVKAKAGILGLKKVLKSLMEEKKRERKL